MGPRPVNQRSSPASYCLISRSQLAAVRLLAEDLPRLRIHPPAAQRPRAAGVPDLERVPRVLVAEAADADAVGAGTVVVAGGDERPQRGHRFGNADLLGRRRFGTSG